MPSTVTQTMRVTDTLHELCQRFPLAFNAMSDQIRPLKIGVYDDLLAQCPDLDPQHLRQAIRFYTTLQSYRYALAAEGAMRIDLAGAPVAPVSAEHAAYALVRQAWRTGAKATPHASQDGTAPAQVAVWCANPGTLLQGVQPVSVAAKLMFTLREIPQYKEKDGYVYLALVNQQRGLPAGVPLADVPLYLGIAVKQWNKARQSAAAFQRQGTPFVLVIETHVGVKDGALVALAKGIQVLEGKAQAPKEKTA